MRYELRHRLRTRAQASTEHCVNSEFQHEDAPASTNVIATYVHVGDAFAFTLTRRTLKNAHETELRRTRRETGPK